MSAGDHDRFSAVKDPREANFTRKYYFIIENRLCLVLEVCEVEERASIFNQLKAKIAEMEKDELHKSKVLLMKRRQIEDEKALLIKK